MLSRALLLISIVLIHAAPLHAQKWTSSDGFLSVTPPEEGFQALPSPPAPFLALWISDDETTKLGIMKLELPSDVKLVQSKAEEGLAEEIQGEVTRLPTSTISGHEVWSMVGKSSSVEITQAIVRREETIYKLMAVTLPGEGDRETVEEFVRSLKVNDDSRQSSSPMTSRSVASGSTESAGESSGEVDSHYLSKKIGGAAALLGIVLIAYFWMRGRKAS